MIFVFCIATLCSISMVYAANGPSEEYAVIHFANDDESYYVYDTGEFDNSMPGATYDKSSNTLTISNVKGYYLWIENMGEDFKIKVDGDNELDFLTVHGGDNETNLHITGFGNFYKTYFFYDIILGSSCLKCCSNI